MKEYLVVVTEPGHTGPTLAALAAAEAYVRLVVEQSASPETGTEELVSGMMEWVVAMKAPMPEWDWDWRRREREAVEQGIEELRVWLAAWCRRVWGERRGARPRARRRVIFQPAWRSTRFKSLT